MTQDTEKSPSGALLQRLLQFEEAQKSVEELVSSLSEQQITWQPAPDKWSVAQCVDHLNVTAEQYLPRLEAAVKTARDEERFGDHETRHGWFGNMFIKAVRPGSRKVPAPKVFRPQAQPDLETLLPRFREAQTRFQRITRDASGLDLRRPKIPSPASGLIRFRFGTWLNVMSEHQLRHTAQAMAVTKDPNFPR